MAEGWGGGRLKDWAPGWGPVAKHNIPGSHLHVIASLSLYLSFEWLKCILQPYLAQATRTVSFSLLNSKYPQSLKLHTAKLFLFLWPMSAMASWGCLCWNPSLRVELFPITEMEKVHRSQKCWLQWVTCNLLTRYWLKEVTNMTEPRIWVVGLMSSYRWHGLGHRLPLCTEEVGSCKSWHMGLHPNRNELKWPLRAGVGTQWVVKSKRSSIHRLELCTLLEAEGAMCRWQQSAQGVCMGHQPSGGGLTVSTPRIYFSLIIYITPATWSQNVHLLILNLAFKKKNKHLMPVTTVSWNGWVKRSQCGMHLIFAKGSEMNHYL